MKTRIGFVSNSSSCSFVLGYHSDSSVEPYTKEQVMKVLNLLVDIEKVFKPNAKFEDYFTLDFKPEDMCIDQGKDIISVRKKWEKDCDVDDTDRTDFAKCEGKMIVNSVEDNSVPYWMSEVIQDKFNAMRWHWG